MIMRKSVSQSHIYVCAGLISKSQNTKCHFTPQKSKQISSCLKSSVFWEIRPFSLLKVKPRFRRNMTPPSSWSKNNPSEKRVYSSCYPVHSVFLLGLLFDPEDGGDARKRRFTFIRTTLEFYSVTCNSS